jgi:adenine-specific DNA-methyltransferase
LWKNLRDRKLIGAKFRRQHPLGPYILDFYCAEMNLAVEIDGGQHDSPERREHDNRRTAFLSRLGVQVLRFWNSEIRNDVGLVLAKIKRTIEEKPLTPALSPGRGEGEEGGDLIVKWEREKMVDCSSCAERKKA